MATTPTIITPESIGSKTTDAILSHIEHHKSKIDEQLLASGAVLFRGFEVPRAVDFEAIALTVDSDLKNDYLGTSPRNIIPGCRYVFSASELPPHYPIMQHCEMSFLPTAPRRLMFYCHVAPKIGGETPICDFRMVAKGMKANVKDAFEKRGIRVIRNYGPPGQKGKGAFQLKPWEDMFQTTDKRVVEQKCAENDIRVEWHENDSLRLISEHTAFKIHPESGTEAWFNHLQVFHAHGAAIEYEKIARRQNTFGAWKVNIMLQAMTLYKDIAEPPLQRAMHVTFADGAEIPTDYIRHVQDLIWEHMYFLKWEQGDVIVIDNFSMAHGRMPFEGPREIFVAWTS
jgi:alpha-ketoglutarate-dependent taurine dioxygenase